MGGGVEGEAKSPPLDFQISLIPFLPHPMVAPPPPKKYLAATTSLPEIYKIYLFNFR